MRDTIHVDDVVLTYSIANNPIICKLGVMYNLTFNTQTPFLLYNQLSRVALTLNGGCHLTKLHSISCGAISNFKDRCSIFGVCHASKIYSIIGYIYDYVVSTKSPDLHLLNSTESYSKMHNDVKKNGLLIVTGNCPTLIKKEENTKSKFENAIKGLKYVEGNMPTTNVVVHEYTVENKLNRVSCVGLCAVLNQLHGCNVSFTKENITIRFIHSDIFNYKYNKDLIMSIISNHMSPLKYKSKYDTDAEAKRLHGDITRELSTFILLSCSCKYEPLTSNDMKEKIDYNGIAKLLNGINHN